MTKKYPKELNIWAKSLKVPIEEIQGRYDEEVLKLPVNHPEWTEKQIASRALKITFTFAKSLRSSRATPYDIMVIGLSGVRDMNAKKKKVILEMYNDEMNREASITGFDGVRIKVLLNQETGEEYPVVIDNRQWIEWTEPSGKEKQAKNRTFGKELPIVSVRDIVAVGKKSFPEEGDPNDLKILRISALKKPAIIIPKVWSPIRTRLNIREDLGLFVNARTVAATTWGTEVDVDWASDDINTLEGKYSFLEGMPDIFQVSDLGSELDAWHALNSDDFSRFCIVEGDIAFMGHEANAGGSYSMSIEDLSAFDLEADAIQGFLPEELYKTVSQWGEGTHVISIVRTSMSNVWDREKGAVADPDPETGEIPQRMQFNYMMVCAGPTADAIVDREEYEDEADEITGE